MQLKKYWGRIHVKGEFAKNAFILTVGTSISQLLPIFFYPVLSRLFTPAEFGLLATLNSITAMLLVFASGKYDQSILITKSKAEAANVIGLVLTLSFGFLLLSFIGLQLAANQLSLLLNEPSLQKWLFYSPVTAFAIIIFNAYNEWCVRNKYFKILSWNKITNSMSHTLAKVGLGFVHYGNGLVIGDMIGRIFSAGTCIYRGLKQDKTVFQQISSRQFIPLAKKYKNFPKFVIPDQFLNSLGVAAPVFFIGAWFNSQEVGFYSMTIQILSLPISVISRAVRDVFRQRANEDFVREGNCLGIYRKLLFILLGIGTLVTIPAIIFLPPVINIVLGPQWESVGVYAQILIPMMTLNFISMSLSGVFIVVNKMNVSMYWQMYYAGITVASLLIGVLYFETMLMTMVCLAVARGSAYIFYIVLSYRFSKGV